MRQVARTSWSHHIDIEWLKEAYRRASKDGASGVDQVRAEEYALQLEANLQALLDREAWRPLPGTTCETHVHPEG